MKSTDQIKPYLLVVDDEPALRLLLAAYFKKQYEVLLAENGEQALEMLKLSKPQAMVVDISMEGMDGLSLIRELRASTKWHQIPILVLSGNDTSNDRIVALRAGADDYLIKPFNPEELEVRLENIQKRMASLTKTKVL
ncbi:MAG: response regulator transcription factor [Cytophagales bacterium]|jgi:DNA-binding response OmpR family regulator|nr:response regulator transcription factor [Cytophagales bacterium]MCE2892910.1 response regulator transcription factor [Flammeovirgaceae bacterium]MCA6369448.1 response regulator transcription factor [Cytophagales bacterium]MCA6373175.1 response regulator transcription factor [Cytophagales bacterium]MCA6376397.1 response regulator transcription factor [Cytophagales bacterium]